MTPSRVPPTPYRGSSGTSRTPVINGITNELVFAAKAVPDAVADGGFHWVAVGNGTAGQTNVLDTTAANLFGSCAASAAQERACSLNKDATVDAEDPRVAAGTLTPGGATVPWVAWSETIGAGRHGIFVSRLVGGDHFELFNQGQPVSNTLNDATRPDIAFSGNTPYITWQENVAGQFRTFSGHFEGGAATPVFKLDTPTGIARAGTRRPAPAGLVDVHGQPDQRRWQHLSGCRCRHAVLPLRRRRSRRAAPVCRSVRAE